MNNTLSFITRNKLVHVNKNGYSRQFHAATGMIYYCLRNGTTTVGGTFSLMEMTHPVLRINTARRLRVMRSVVKGK